MSFLNNVARGGVGFMTGGLSELGRKDPFGFGRSNGPSGPAPWNPITASNVNISPDLAATLGGIGTAAAGKIGSNYSSAKGRIASEAGAREMKAGANSYAPERLNQVQGLDIGTLGSTLGGQMGDTAYKNALQQRDYNQGISIADETAALNKPDPLQEILMGIGAIGKPAATYAGIKGRNGRSSTPSYANVQDPYDYMDLG